MAPGFWWRRQCANRSVTRIGPCDELAAREQVLWNPFRVAITVCRLTQGALRDPWAVECNPFGVDCPASHRNRAWRAVQRHLHPAPCQSHFASKFIIPPQAGLFAEAEVEADDVG